MRSILSKILAVCIALTLLTSIATAGKKKEEKKVKLPNGKVLINPYVISENPNGLEVGHNNGIVQIPFKDCPKRIQEKYGYSPKKAAAYNKQQAIKKQNIKKQESAKAKKKKVEDEQFRRYRRDASLENMEIEIKKLENRIAFLKKEIPKLENNQNNLLDKTTQMATTSVAGDNNSNSGGYSWFGGYTTSSSNSAGRRAERTKQRQISKLDDEYAVNKHNVKSYTKELAKKEIDLIKLKQRLAKSKKKKETEAPMPKK